MASKMAVEMVASSVGEMADRSAYQSALPLVAVMAARWAASLVDWKVGEKAERRDVPTAASMAEKRVH